MKIQLSGLCVIFEQVIYSVLIPFNQIKRCRSDDGLNANAGSTTFLLSSV
ncbi:MULTISPECIES: hypothetical protein [Klebsiella]|nr:hypothetical protein [Klebsiella pneumoniae]HBR1311116.1 hypothetical protein [Klebsiella quasipneumoniae subsp. quasipneumoniae]HCI4651142.1 hypothetical protein [Klebsiella quasipneumoniae subsp. quasipneumoniae]HCJ7666365.1 hypothetical protein [Enterobacter hormaechei subsp. xiangfangensis]HCM8069528.1 hypothetical protein [Klebsiella variicola]